MSRFDDLDLGLVVVGHGRHYLVETPEGRRLVCHPRGKKSDCVVGDRVRWAPSGADEGVIEHVEPRRNLLFRQDEWKTKSFAANLDQLLILVAVEPVFSESQLARSLIAAESAGISATIALESTPPLRKAPTGTSATICRRTARSSRSRTPRVASSSVIVGSGANTTTQYGCSATPEQSTVSQWPGSSFRTPSQIVVAPTACPNAR